MESDQATLLTSLASFFDTHHIAYMITGAWSVIFYGRPRASHDIDFVVELHSENIDRTIRSISTDLSSAFIVEKNAIRQSITEHAQFQMLHRDTLLKIDVWLLTDDPYDQARFRRKKRVSILKKQMSIASAEDTILQKLKWYKTADLEKHIIDAAFVYQIQQKSLDDAYLNHWAQRLGVVKNLKKLETIDLEPYL